MKESLAVTQPYVHSRWKALGYTTIFSLSIAVLLWFLEVAQPLWASITVSLCIGWCITLSFVFLGTPLNRVLPAYVAPIPLVGIGLLAGLVIAGTLLFGRPLFFVTEDYGSIVLGVFFGIVGFALFGVRGRLMEARAELERARAEREAQEKLLVETELKLLQAQIEPHFLFNTLSNIIGLIHKEPDVAEQTLLNLTTLLRASLRRTREEETTLGEELDIISAYLEIQSIRMPSRLHYEVDAQPETRALPFPPLLVQPLVENAIKHGIDPSEEGGRLCVSSALTDDELRIRVSDTGIGIDSASPNGGTGLSNVRSRLNALYEGLADMRVADNEPSGVEVTIAIPRSAL